MCLWLMVALSVLVITRERKERRFDAVASKWGLMNPGNPAALQSQSRPLKSSQHTTTFWGYVEENAAYRCLDHL
jgi:hypothetical protein